MNHTHRTIRNEVVEIRSGYRIESRVVPAGTTGVIEYEGIVGGEPCVMFRGGGMEANLIGKNALQVERIEGAAA